MLIALVVASGLIAWWGTWLVGTRVVPAWTKFVAPIVVASTVINGFLTLRGLRHAFDAVGEANPGEKASNLARGISNAMIPMGVASAVVAIAVAILGLLTLRAKRRPV